MNKFLIGIALGVAMFAVREKGKKMYEETTKLDHEADLLSKGLNGYMDGFIDGKSFFITHHEVNHPECNRCPH